MKNQYFGDIRDLFKYDMVVWLIRQISSLENFTFIPMLTENDPSKKDGSQTDPTKAKAGFINEDLKKSPGSGLYLAV
jgi:hypothetical protein